MSRFKIPIHFRFPIYNIHKRKCIWCKEPIKYTDLEIDHIIPEALLDCPEELRKVMNLYGLPDDYCINGLENLVPSCHGCNNTKSNLVYAPTPVIQMVIDESRRCYEKKVAESNRFQKEMKTPKNEAFLENALQRGDISPDSIREVLKRFEDSLLDKSSVMSSFITVSGMIPSIDKTWKYDEALGEKMLVFNGIQSAITILPDHFSLDMICKNCLHPGPWIGNVCQTCGKEQLK